MLDAPSGPMMLRLLVAKPRTAAVEPPGAEEGDRQQNSDQGPGLEQPGSSKDGPGQPLRARTAVDIEVG
jgi:hypothetical protein